MCKFIREVEILKPYVEELIEGMKQLLCDAVPAIRHASATALSKLNTGLGGEKTESIRVWITNILKNAKSTDVQRFGAAEGLSMLYLSFPKDRQKEELAVELNRIEDIVQNEQSEAIRKSYIEVVKYLPSALKEDLTGNLDQILDIITLGFADKNEGVREVALQAGKMTIFVLGSKAPVQVTQHLQPGIEHENLHVRENTLKILGDLLYANAGGQGEVIYDSECSEEME
eukprot:UN06598